MDKMLIMAALAKAQQLLLDPQEREYVLSQINAAKGRHMNMKTYFYMLIIYPITYFSSVFSDLCFVSRILSIHGS